jgi:hypothetical protein
MTNQANGFTCAVCGVLFIFDRYESGAYKGFICENCLSRKLKRDIVISITDKADQVGVYFADTDGSEVLFETSPEIADEIIKLWNNNVREKDKIIITELKRHLKGIEKAIEKL